MKAQLNVISHLMPGHVSMTMYTSVVVEGRGGLLFFRIHVKGMQGGQDIFLVVN